MTFPFLLFVVFGTGEGLLRYGIRIRCSKRLPGVRDAFSEAHSVLKTGFYGTEGIFGAGNPLLWYGTDTRIGPRSEDAAECGSRFEDATVVEVVPVAAAMDLLA